MLGYLVDISNDLLMKNSTHQSLNTISFFISISNRSDNISLSITTLSHRCHCQEVKLSTHQSRHSSLDKMMNLPRQCSRLSYCFCADSVLSDLDRCEYCRPAVSPNVDRECLTGVYVCVCVSGLSLSVTTCWCYTVFGNPSDSVTCSDIFTLTLNIWVLLPQPNQHCRSQNDLYTNTVYHRYAPPSRQMHNN